MKNKSKETILLSAKKFNDKFTDKPSVRTVQNLCTGEQQRNY
jgi:hypothetical protein